jgi:hypothetical protein
MAKEGSVIVISVGAKFVAAASTADASMKLIVPVPTAATSGYAIFYLNIKYLSS